MFWMKNETENCLHAVKGSFNAIKDYMLIMKNSFDGICDKLSLLQPGVFQSGSLSDVVLFTYARFMNKLIDHFVMIKYNKRM